MDKRVIEPALKFGAQFRIIVAILTSLFRASTSTQKLPRQKWPQKKWILGHRGARAIAPENTLVSFQLAMKHGADGVEFDVFLSSDGIPVIIHDDTLERTTDGRGAVQDKNAAELWELNATKNSPGFAKEGVPTLEKTLIMLPDGAIANVELKGSGYYSKELFVDKVLDVLQRHKARLHLIISSFDGELLSLFRQVDGSYLLSLLLSTRDENWPHALACMGDIKPDALHLPGELAGPLVRIVAHIAKMRIAIWTVNDVKQAKQWLDRYVAGIFTDRVPELVEGSKEV